MTETDDMNALTLLLERQSMGKLAWPEPTAVQIETLYRSALRAPDHGALTPWRLIEIRGENALGQLGDLLAEAERADTPDVDARRSEATRAKALRAPLVIAVVAAIKPGQPKIPDSEQLLSAGCAAHAILLAAHAQGLGAMWRTGPYAHHSVIRKGLGLGEHDVLIGFVYVGQPAGRMRDLTPSSLEDFVESWPSA
ncbi:nitroreductase family protein [Larsenimonas salina]|uniref:nitroreductase family protein n=1 Tax=Larsenimonas salina TaxID=1295565 RepID=UPI0032EDA8D5